MEPIVPERNDRIGKREGVSRNPQPKSKPDKPKQPKNSSGIVARFFRLALIVAVLGLGFLSFQQFQQLQQLQQQFDNLRAKIESTDESLSQSGTTLSIRIQNQGEQIKAHENKLNEHFSEIDKLWAARNKNKEAASNNAKTLADLKKDLAATKKAISNAVAEANGAKTAVLSSQAEMAELADQLDKILTQAAQSENALKQWQVKTNNRISDTEDAIKAIDAFRRSVNQQLLALRTQSGEPNP